MDLIINWDGTAYIIIDSMDINHYQKEIIQTVNERNTITEKNIKEIETSDLIKNYLEIIKEKNLEIIKLIKKQEIDD